MSIDLQTPSLVFSATSLLMLAYTNRFLTLAGLVRDLIHTHHDTHDDVILDQISNLQVRMNYIRKMQLFGAFSFTFAIASTLIQMFDKIDIAIAAWLFIFSLIFLLISLLYLVSELRLSNDALTYQLETLKKEKTD